jgi:hypothetical protein
MLKALLRYLQEQMLAAKKLALGITMVALIGCEGRSALRIYRDAGAADTAGKGATAGVVAPQCPEGTSPRLVELGTPVKLDLLFLVDDSPSMQEEQGNLARNFRKLIEELTKMPTGFPDLHLGVVSANMGAGQAVIPDGCGNAGGDRGVLQVRPGCGLDPKNGRYLISRDGGTNNNFDGDIADVFACMAQLGTDGCGFEHQLQSVRMALSGFVSDNAGFLRPDGHLAVVYITDEDDCSAPANTTIFENLNSQVDPSLRCSVYGHICNGRPVQATEFETPLANCSAAPDGSGQLVPVQTFVDEMKRLKTQSVSVSVIAGWPADLADASYGIGYGVDDRSPTMLTSTPICWSANGKAAVGLRLKQFVDAFGGAGKLISICQDDFSEAMAQVGELINTTVECQ